MLLGFGIANLLEAQEKPSNQGLQMVLTYRHTLVCPRFLLQTQIAEAVAVIVKLSLPGNACLIPSDPYGRVSKLLQRTFTTSQGLHFREPETRYTMENDV